MGKILLISDIHGNMPAVYALEKEIQRLKPDKIFFLGDSVGKGPENDKSADWVRDNCSLVLRGNWDDGIGNGYFNHSYPNDEFYWKQVGKERAEWLLSLPFEGELLISGKWFRLVHGRPSDRLYQAYDDWDDLKKGFTSSVSSQKYDGYICADSHMPYVRTCDLGYAINTGSIGNGIGLPIAHCVVMEGEIDSSVAAPFKIEILSIPYDNAASAEIMRRCEGHPNPSAYINEVLTGVYSR